jgi:outer membrane protein assembly factor BamB
LSTINSSPTVVNDTGYVGSIDGSVYAMDDATGEVLWATDTGAPVDSSPAIANGLLYVGTDAGHLYAIERFDDVDGDGVYDPYDLCGGSTLPDSFEAKRNRYSADVTGVFADPNGRLVDLSIFDTFGCTGEQIAYEIGSRNHQRFGPTRSLLLDWISLHN